MAFFLRQTSGHIQALSAGAHPSPDCMDESDPRDYKDRNDTAGDCGCRERKILPAPAPTARRLSCQQKPGRPRLTSWGSPPRAVPVLIVPAVFAASKMRGQVESDQRSCIFVVSGCHNVAWPLSLLSFSLTIFLHAPIGGCVGSGDEGRIPVAVMTESPHDKAASVAWKRPAGGPADEELVLQARDGQVPAFEELVRRHYGLVFSIGLAWLDNPEQAEDLVQEVFVRAYLFLGRLDRPPAFHGWVAQIARNLSADWLRRGSAASRIVPMVSLDASHAEIPDTRSEGVRERMDRDEQIGAVRDAVRCLPRDQREVILLHYMEGLDQEEIAARLGMHRSSVSRMLERARKSMRGLLEPVLRDTMPALRPAPRAVGQVLAVVGTVAAMGAMQKSAIASAAGLMSVPAASVQAPVAAAASLIAILKAAGAAIVTGGTVMGVPKGIILATTAVGLTVGGVYYANRDGSPPPPPVAASPISAAAPATATTSLIPPQDEAVPPKYADWMEAVRAFSAQHPDNKGLGHLAQALGNVNVSAAGAQRAAMDAILSRNFF